MTELEDKEIRGVTAKQLIWLFGSLGSILVAVLVNYFSIVGRIDRVNDGMDNIRQSNQMLQIEIEKIKTQQNNLEIRLLTIEVQLKEKRLIPVE